MNEVCQSCRYREPHSGICMNLKSSKCGLVIMSFDKCNHWKDKDDGSEQRED